MSNKEQIIDILKKMSVVKIIMPDGWSDDKQLNGHNISYKTYNGGSDYMTMEITLNGVDTYKINYHYGDIIIEEPFDKHLSQSKIVELVKTVYTEAISPEMITEGKVLIREKIAQARKEIKRKKIDINNLLEQLNGEEKTSEV